MSIQAVAWVLDHSQSRGFARLVLIALANHANDQQEAWPAQRTIAREAGISAGSVPDQVRKLVGLGELEVVEQGGARRSTRYRMTFAQEMSNKPETRSGDERSARPRSEQNHQEPSKTDLLPTVVDLGARERNEIWDALVEVFGDPTTDSNRRLRGKICASLKRAGATHDQIMLRARAWPAHFDEAELTETALEKHWDRLGRPPLRADADQYHAAVQSQQRLLRAAELDAEHRGLPG